MEIKKRGGVRKNAGRKPDIDKIEIKKLKEKISTHGLEIDLRTKKSRVLSILDVMYELAISGNMQAMKEYLNRQIGNSENLNINLSEERPVVGFNIIKPKE